MWQKKFKKMKIDREEGWNKNKVEIFKKEEELWK